MQCMGAEQAVNHYSHTNKGSIKRIKQGGLNNFIDSMCGKIAKLLKRAIACGEGGITL